MKTKPIKLEFEEKNGGINKMDVSDFKELRTSVHIGLSSGCNACGCSCGSHCQGCGNCR